MLDITKTTPNTSSSPLVTVAAAAAARLPIAQDPDGILEEHVVPPHCEGQKTSCHPKGHEGHLIKSHREELFESKDYMGDFEVQIEHGMEATAHGPESTQSSEDEFNADNELASRKYN